MEELTPLVEYPHAFMAICHGFKNAADAREFRAKLVNCPVNGIEPLLITSRSSYVFRPDVGCYSTSMLSARLFSGDRRKVLMLRPKSRPRYFDNFNVGLVCQGVSRAIVGGIQVGCYSIWRYSDGSALSIPVFKDRNKDRSWYAVKSGCGVLYARSIGRDPYTQKALTLDTAILGIMFKICDSNQDKDDMLFVDIKFQLKKESFNLSSHLDPELPGGTPNYFKDMIYHARRNYEKHHLMDCLDNGNKKA